MDSLLNVGSACVCCVFLLSVLIELGALSVRSIQGKHVSLCTGRQSQLMKKMSNLDRKRTPSWQ